MERGWFPVHRKIFDSDVWQHPTARVVLIYLLGNVTHQEVTLSERYQAVTLQPAQILTSVARIAAKCRLSSRSVRTALTYLISTNRVTIRTTKRFSVITVTNWPAYRGAMAGNDKQYDKQNDHQPTNSRQTADNIQKKIKKVEKKKKDLPLAPAPLEGAEHRDQIEGEPDNSPEAIAERRRQIEEAKKLHGITTDKDSGNGSGVSKGKTREEDNFTTEQKAAIAAAHVSILRGEPLDDVMLRLQVTHGLTTDQVDQVEPLIAEGRTTP